MIVVKILKESVTDDALSCARSVGYGLSDESEKNAVV